MPSIFSRIIAGEIPCYNIYEDEYTFAFLDINPYTLGHTLIVPKREVDHFFDLPEPYYTAIFQTAKKLAPAIQQATGTKRVSQMIVGLEVDHVHVHLVPTNTIADLQHSAIHTETSETMHAIQEKITALLRNK
jgi:histidine triad (HIT) family protein